MTADLYDEMFSRNFGFISSEEQAILRTSTIGIAGVGGNGGLLAERLIRLGVGNIKITDPEDFDYSNFNRQFGADTRSVSKRKTVTVFEQIRYINPQANIYHDTIGITDAAGAKEFVSDCSLVIDEMDMTAFRESIMLQRAARRQGIYYLFSSAIGFGALATVFDPQGMTLEEYNNLPVDVDLDDIGKIDIPISKAVPVMPSYIPTDITAISQDIAAGRMGVPTTGIGAGLAALLAANEAINILIHKRPIVKAPEYIYLDLMDQRFIVDAGA